MNVTRTGEGLSQRLHGLRGALALRIQCVNHAMLFSCLMAVLPLCVPRAGGQTIPRPNELGRIPILEYHLIEQNDTRWGRSAAGFRHDLERLYRAGYRTLGVGDYIDGRIALAAGTHPVILTFDDSSPGQFRYITRNGKAEIDPDCAVGIMIDFSAKHPDFGRKAIFFVLPGAAEPHRLFGQPEYEGRKLRELALMGFEIGNHTLWHANLGKYDALTVKKQLALAVQSIQRYVPGYRVRALSLPFGVYPKDFSLAVEGSYAGTKYHDEAIFLVAGGPAYSPFSKECNLLRLPRIQVTGEALKSWLDRLAVRPDELFTSDGNPTTISFPRPLSGECDTTRFPALRLVAN